MNPFAMSIGAALFFLGIIIGAGAVHFIVLRPLMRFLLIVPALPVTQADVITWQKRKEEVLHLREVTRHAFDKLSGNA